MAQSILKSALVVLISCQLIAVCLSAPYSVILDTQRLLEALQNNPDDYSIIKIQPLGAEMTPEHHSSLYRLSPQDADYLLQNIEFQPQNEQYQPLSSEISEIEYLPQSSSEFYTESYEQSTPELNRVAWKVFGLNMRQIESLLKRND